MEESLTAIGSRSDLPPFFQALLRGEDQPKPKYAVNKPSKIVMLHGLFMDHTCWLQTASKLRDLYGHSVLLVDFYGHGNSPTLQDYKEMDLQTLLLQVEYAIKSVGWQDEQVVLAGVSLGGCVSMAFTQRFPDQVRRVVLFAPAGLSEHGRFAVTRTSSKFWLGILQMLDFLQQKVNFMQQVVQWRGIRWFLGIAHLTRLTPTFGLDQAALEELFKQKELVVVYAENDWFHTVQRDRLEKIHEDIKVIVIPRVGHVEFCLKLDQHEFHHQEGFWHHHHDLKNDRKHDPSDEWRQEAAAVEQAVAGAF